MNTINSNLEIVSFHLYNHFLRSYKKDISFHPLDRNGDAHLLDMLPNESIDFLIGSWDKWDWSIEEELFTLLIDVLV